MTTNDDSAATDPVATEKNPPPPWLIPALIAGLVVLLIVLLVVVLTNGGDDDVDDTLSPATTADPAATETTADPAGAAPATEPPTTEAPATIDAPTNTEAPASTAPTATTPESATPPSGGAAAAQGQAIITTTLGTLQLTEAASCRVTAAPGLNIYSYLYDGGEFGPFLLEVVSDEGASPGVALAQIGGELEAFNGQDNAAGSYWATDNAPDTFAPVTDLVLEPIGGFADAPATVSFNFSQDTESCASGFFADPWPFTSDQAPEVLDQFDPTLNGSYAFSVLAACNGASDTVLLSEAGILSSFDLNGEQLTTIQLFPNSNSPLYLSRDGGLPNDVLIDQQGGGGDVTYVTRVSEFGSTDSSYLTWTQPPTGVTGGLPVVNC